METPTFYATPGREPSEVLGRAFASGCGGEFDASRIKRSGPAAFYGTSPATLGVISKCRAGNEDYYYVDNGYLRPGHYDGHFRVTKNAEQHDGVSGPVKAGRWEALGLRLDRWRKTGRHILFPLQTERYFKMRGMRLGRILIDTFEQLGFVTDRPIVVRPKPNRRNAVGSLDADLDGAWCVVTYSSNVAVDALLRGVPVVTLGPCAANPMSTALDAIENPFHGDRETWVRVLASNQWAVDEISNGTCWRHLSERA